MDSDASLHSSDSSVFIMMPSVVTQRERHVLDEEGTKEVVENQELVGQVQDLIATHISK